MLTKRAEEIIASPENIKVVYGEQPVWIDRVNSAQNTAHVHTLTGRTQKLEVPIGELKETGALH